MSANFWSVRSNTLVKLIPKVKCRYLERSCPRRNGAVKNKTTRQRIELRIVFIFISDLAALSPPAGQLEGRTWPAPLHTKGPAGFRLLRQRRPCGKSS